MHPQAEIILYLLENPLTTGEWTPRHEILRALRKSENDYTLKDLDMYSLSDDYRSLAGNGLISRSSKGIRLHNRDRAEKWLQEQRYKIAVKLLREPDILDQLLANIRQDQHTHSSGCTGVDESHRE